MSIHNSLKKKMPNTESPVIQGQWWPVRFCADLAADEHLNVGVLLQTNDGMRHIRMLNHFARLQCLYDKRINETDLIYLFDEAEAALEAEGSDAASALGPHINLGEPLYAAGENAESIMDTFYDTIVTLARPRKRGPKPFGHISATRVRSQVLDKMRQDLALRADTFIQKQPLELKIGQQQLTVDLPLVGRDALGAIASAYYKNPMVIANHIMHAVSDLSLAKQCSNRNHTALSVLIPGNGAGLNTKETHDVNRELRYQLDRSRALNITILQGTTIAEVAQATADWWRNAA